MITYDMFSKDEEKWRAEDLGLEYDAWRFIDSLVGILDSMYIHKEYEKNIEEDKVTGYIFKLNKMSTLLLKDDRVYDAVRLQYARHGMFFGWYDSNAGTVIFKPLTLADI